MTPNITGAQTILRDMFIDAGMPLEVAAIHAIFATQFIIQNKSVANLIVSAIDSDDTDFKREVIGGLLNRVQELIIENMDLIQDIAERTA